MNVPWFVWLIALPLFGAPIIYLFANRRYVLPVLGCAWVLFVLAVGEVGTTFTLGIVSLRLDGLALPVMALTLALGTLVALYSGPYMRDESGEMKFYALLLTMLGALLGLCSAGDLFNLWLWFELLTATAYLLTAFYRNRPASLEAGIKYLVQSATGSALALVGIALVFWQVGTLDLVRIQAALDPWLLVAGALLVVGFGVKAAFVPVHTWLPDAHSQAPSGISAMLSGIVIEASLVALLRVLIALGVSWGSLLMGMGALNMLVGNLMALRQKEIKRLLAYSSVAQVGYMLFGAGIAVYSGQSGAMQGMVFYVLAHGLLKGLAFLAAGALLYALHTAVTTDDLAGAAERYPLTAFALSVAVLGLGGLPPLAGFMAKWQVFASGVAVHDPLIDVLVIFAALNSILSLAYYAPIVNTIYRHQQSPLVQGGTPLALAMRAPLALLTVAVIIIGIWPNVLNWLVVPASTALGR